jgi:leucyl aminopeptidase (aminopeptidase T)
MMDFPSPEIGENFEAIFEDMLEINSLDSTKYELIQQKMIDVLDVSDHVHIKGKGTNCTNIIVKLQPILKPEAETNFNNCVADINIPVGEVFTSPQLAGTDGILHIEDAFLDNFAYENLKLSFKDGYVAEYSCTNQENEESCKTYIYENLLQKHKTLPLGEFAIGTNTLAYVKAKKHGIIKLLPVLILEKMGPHFAIGDTCYAWDEDTPVINTLNNKRMTAVENEKSAMRKVNAEESYTGVHTDITLPFESIGSITTVTKEGERTDIIRDGRFVLKGTEELNLPFDGE